MNFVALSEAARVIMGQSPPSSTYNARGEGLPFFQGKAEFGDLYPTARVFCTEPQRVAERGDILISVRAPVGPTNLNPHKSCIGRGLAAIRPIADTDTKYLLYFLRHHEPELARAGTGSTFEAVSRDDIESIKVPLPPHPEQQRIAAMLARADRLRRLRRYALDLSEGYLQAVFVEMFGDPLRNPKGWRALRLGQAFSQRPQIGMTRPADDRGEQLVVRVGEIGNGDVALERCKRTTLHGVELRRFLLAPGDILIARAIGSLEHLGKASILQPTDHTVVFDSHVMRLRFKPAAVHPRYFLEWLQSSGGRQRFLQRAGRTAVQYNVNSEQISDVEIALPPVSGQDEFVHVAHRMDRLRAQQREAARQAEQLFGALLDRAFRGEL